MERPLCGTLCPTRGPWPGPGPPWRPSPRWPRYLMAAMASMAFCRTAVSRRSVGSSCSSAWRAQREGTGQCPPASERLQGLACRAAPSQRPHQSHLPAPGAPRRPPQPCSGKGRAQHPARGCSPRGRASPHLDSLRHLQLAEIHRVPGGVVRDGGFAGVADGGQKPQLLCLSLSRGGERQASGSGEPSSLPAGTAGAGAARRRPAAAAQRASGTLGLRLQQARMKLRASSSSCRGAAEAEGPTPEPEGACSGCTSLSS